MILFPNRSLEARGILRLVLIILVLSLTACANYEMHSLTVTLPSDTKGRARSLEQVKKIVREVSEQNGLSQQSQQDIDRQEKVAREFFKQNGLSNPSQGDLLQSYRETAWGIIVSVSKDGANGVVIKCNDSTDMGGYKTHVIQHELQLRLEKELPPESVKDTTERDFNPI